MREATYREARVPLFRHISGTFASNLGCLAMGLGSSILLNRTLGPEGKGVYATLLTTAQLTVMLAGLGLGKSAVFYLANREEPPQAVFRNLLTLTALTLAGALGLLALARVLAVPHQALRGDHIYYLGLLTVFSMSHSSGLSALRGLKQFGICNLLGLGTSGLFLGLVVFSIARGGFDPHVAVLCRAAALGGILLLIAWQLGGRGLSFGIGRDTAIQRKLLGYGIAFFFYQVFQNLSYRFDIILVSNLGDYAQAGWYSTGTGLAELIWYFPNAVGMVLFPVAAGMAGAEGDALVCKVCRWSLAVMGLGVAALVLLAPWVVRFLYGDRFLPSVTVIYALSGGILTNGLFQILGIHLAARKQLRQLAGITAAGFAANVLLNCIWIPRWGVVGAGLASTVSYSITGFLTALAFRRTTGRSWGELFLITPAEFREVCGTLGRKLRRLT